MRQKEPRLIIFLKFILFSCFIVISLFIGFYKFSRQSLTVVVHTDKGTLESVYEADYIKDLLVLDEDGNPVESEKDNNEVLIDIEWVSLGASELKEIDIYRYFKSIIISKINSSNIWDYGYIDEHGVHFNKAGVEHLYDYTRSMLLERLILEEMLVTVFLLLWILINAVKEKLDLLSRNNHGPIYEITNFVKNLRRYKKYIFFAAKADLNAEVANSYLNRLWWILEPFCNMIVYVIVFGHVLGNNIERYSTYVFSALIMWNFFSHVINYSVKCVRSNRDIVTKIYVPKYILLQTNMVLNFIKLMFSMAVLIIMLCIFHVPISWTIIWLIPSYLLMLLLVFGIGMIFLHYGVFIDDLAYAVNILLSMLMFMSGIFYDVITSLSEPLNHILMCINPVVIFVDTMRGALLYNRVANIPLIGIWTVLSLLIGYIGIHIVNKNENGYVKVI